jgi:putative sigma-54 modulation protein
MNLQITFKHMQASEPLRDYATEKCQRLAKYLHGNFHLVWTFEVKKLVKSAHCHLLGNHIDYFGQGETEDFMASIDEAIERIEKQLRKHKEIVTNHLHHAPADVPASEDEPA